MTGLLLHRAPPIDVPSSPNAIATSSQTNTKFVAAPSAHSFGVVQDGGGGGGGGGGGAGSSTAILAGVTSSARLGQGPSSGSSFPSTSASSLSFGAAAGGQNSPMASGMPMPSNNSGDSVEYFSAPYSSTARPMNGGSSAQAGPSRVFPPPSAPRSFTILKEVGDGSFGTVWLADWHSPLELPPGTTMSGPRTRPEYRGKQVVAIKRMKKAFEGGWDECLKLKELKALQQIPMHPHIIPLYDAFLYPSTKELYFVFECMEGNLYQLTKSRKGRRLASGLIASIFHQALCGLDHIHRCGYFHRDMKPENVLITTTGLADYPASSLFAPGNAPPEKDVTVVLKLADFGLARETMSQPPYTEYVSTRWYRAPEILLRSRDYSNPVDMWALGTILVEVINLKPLFPGDSEVDQVYKICEILGNPSSSYGYDERGRMCGGGPWSRGVKMASIVGFSFPQLPPVNLSSLFDTSIVPIQLIDCIADLLRYDPKTRLTSAQCLDHAYFREVAWRFAPPHTLGVPAHILQMAQQHLSSRARSTNTAASSGSGSRSSSREVPPSHSASAARGSPRLPFPHGDAGGSAPMVLSTSGQQLPPAGLPRQDSIVSASSTEYGMSGYPVQVANAHGSPAMQYPESVDDRADTQSLADSTHSGQLQQAYWAAHQAAPLSTNRPAPPFGGGAPSTRQRRSSLTGSIAPSLAPSTFYDGSIFEGVGNNRPSSVLSFPSNAGYASSMHQGQGSPPLGYPSSPPLGSNDQEMQVDAQPQQEEAPQPQPAPQQSSKRNWGLGSVFSSGDKQSSQSQASNPLKRAPSLASVQDAAAAGAQAPPPNSKAAKKQAEKAAKEAEKAKREAMQIAARERARAVMRKKQMLMEAADPLHASANPSRPVPDVASSSKSTRSYASSNRAPSIASSQRLPGISEHGGQQLKPVDMRHKYRRREDDDDVHSISSTSTGHSSQRRFSISSAATNDTDGSRRLHFAHQVPYNALLQQQYGQREGMPSAPSTSHSSIDLQLVQNMQSLATTTSHEMDGTGYTSPPLASPQSSRTNLNGSGTTLPPISTMTNPHFAHGAVDPRAFGQHRQPPQQ